MNTHRHLARFTYPQIVQFKDWTCRVERSFYIHGGVPALVLLADREQRGSDGEPIGKGEAIATATVNLPDPILLGHVWIKSWAENEGMADALIKAGIIGPELGRVPTGHVVATIHKLLEPTNPIEN